MRPTLTVACVFLVVGLSCATAADGAMNHLRIVNQCSGTVWIQQDSKYTLPGTPVLAELAAGQSRDYPVPTNGFPSTRFWPKTGCDSNGNNCTLGQSSPPCPTNSYGCAPPVDSKLEATWGCLTSPASTCALNPSSGQPLTGSTWFDASLVDGFTLPFSVTVKSADTSSGCTSPAICPAIKYQSQCPTSADLSTDGHFPALKNQNLQVMGPNGVAGCFSPCGKLTYAKQYGGYNYAPTAPQAAYYCCQSVNGTNPIPGLDPGTSPGCNAGPAPKTSYVQYAHAACKKSVYAFAYDDAIGTRVCQGATSITFTLCP
jgi:hypothetical protein